MITREQLARLAPHAGQRVDVYLQPLNAAMEEFGINSDARRSKFLPQILHETGGLAALRENLNYSPEGLMATFNTKKIVRFTKTDAYRYGRTSAHPADQRMIANIAYAGRYGNGPVESNDGWRYRGGGAGHLTFKDNYKRCGAALGIDLVSHPELIERPDIACRSFAWYWTKGNPLRLNLNELADAGDIAGISKAVNGGNNGLAERIALTRLAEQVLA